MLFNSAIAIPLFVSCDVLIPYPDIQGWLRWLYELNPWVRIIASMLSTELQYVPLPPPSPAKKKDSLTTSPCL